MIFTVVLDQPIPTGKSEVEECAGGVIAAEKRLGVALFMLISCLGGVEPIGMMHTIVESTCEFSVYFAEVIEYTLIDFDGKTLKSGAQEALNKLLIMSTDDAEVGWIMLNFIGLVLIWRLVGNCILNQVFTESSHVQAHVPNRLELG